MSDRTRHRQPTVTTGSEPLDLSALRSSTDAARLVHESTTDLSQVSLSSANVHRSPTRPQSRMRQLLRPTPTISTLRAEVTQRNTKHTATPARRKQNGIIKDPFYRYQGGPIERLITLLANILKALEQLILRFLSGNRGAQTPAPPPQHATRRQKEDLDTAREKKEKKEKDDKKLDDLSNLSIHRS